MLLMKWIIYTFCLTICFLSPQDTVAQIIEQMENGGGSSGGDSSGEIVFDNDIDLWIDLIFFGAQTFGGIFFGFPAEWETRNEQARAGGVEMTRYPYDESNGLYRMRAERGYGIRTQVNLQYLTNEDLLHGFQAQLKFFPHPVASLEVNHLQLFEALDDEPDQLGFTNIFAQFNRIRHHKFHLWWGLGAMHMAGAADETALGVNAGFTWYVKKPISIYADMQMAFLTSFPRQIYQFRLQAHHKRFKFFGGYEGIQMNTDNGRNRFHTPMWVIGSGVHF